MRARRTRGAYQPGAGPSPLRQATFLPPGGYRPADQPDDGPERDDYEQGDGDVERDRDVGLEKPDTDHDGVGHQAGIELRREAPHVGFGVVPPDEVFRDRVVPKDADEMAKMPSLNASIREVRRLSTRRRSAGPGSLIQAASHGGPGAAAAVTARTAYLLDLPGEGLPHQPGVLVLLMRAAEIADGERNVVQARPLPAPVCSEAQARRVSGGAMAVRP